METVYICNLEKRYREERYREEQTVTMQVRISSYNRDRIAKGTIVFLLNQTEIAFSGLDQMCLIIEEYLDRQPFFGERLEYRFLDKPVPAGRWFCDEEKGHESQNVFSMEKTGDVEKFSIRIRGRANRSLQGELWTENQKCCFRSGLELMRMIHQKLQKKYR